MLFLCQIAAFVGGFALGKHVFSEAQIYGPFVLGGILALVVSHFVHLLRPAWRGIDLASALQKTNRK